MKKCIFIISFFLLLAAPWFTIAQELDPGDGVRIKFFNISEEISGDYFVQQNDILQLPYIGSLKLEDKDYNILKAEIVTKYDSLYRGVELIVSPLYRINVLGEVRRPGVYFVTGVEKLLDVIALAGGETEDSDMSEILIQRKNETLNFNAEEIIRGEKNSHDFYLQSGDRIFVTRKWWVTGQNTTFILTTLSLIVTTYAVFSR